MIHHLAVGDLDILTARFGETGQLSLSVYRHRRQGETLATAGLAALSVRAMMRGTLRHSTSELAFAMESLGGTLSPSLGSDLFGLGTTVLSEHAAAAAALIAEVLREPRFAPESVAIERDLLLADARAVTDDMVRFPIQLALGTAFGDRGYGAPALGTPESVGSFTVESVRQWHADLLRGDRTTVIAVGDADPVELADILATVIPSEARDRPERQRSLAPLGMTSETQRSLTPFGMTSGIRTEQRDRKQSALAMFFPGPARRDPARFAAETWSAIAAGLGGRMFESLRSKRSLAYTVIANSWQRARAGGFLTYIATDPLRLGEARDAMLDELAAFRREPPTAEEMSRATAMLAGQVEMSRQTAGEFAGEIADAWLLGEGLGELADRAEPYRAVTAEQVHQLMWQSLDPALRAEGVVAASTTE